jgi:hypothetical protein
VDARVGAPSEGIGGDARGAGVCGDGDATVLDGRGRAEAAAGAPAGVGTSAQGEGGGGLRKEGRRRDKGRDRGKDEEESGEVSEPHRVCLEVQGEVEEGGGLFGD